MNRAVLSDWLGPLAEFNAKYVLVLGPDPFTVNNSRGVVAVYPEDYRGEALALAQSHSFGVPWRATQSPLVAWKNLGGGTGADEVWASVWLARGMQSLVRVDLPMPFSNGFECFMFAGRPLTERNEAANMAWTAMSVWPVVKQEVVGPRFDISKREHEVLVVLAEGFTAKEAAARLGCSERTVAFHLTNVATKLHAPNRAAAIQRACSSGCCNRNKEA